MSSSSSPSASGSEEQFQDLLGMLPSLLLSTPDLEGFLGEVARLAARSVGGADSTSCGITTRSDHGALTTAASDARASVADEGQYVAGAGPCLTAMRSGAMVSVPDLATDGRWPAFRAAALEQGVASVLSLPLLVERQPVGALNLYAFEGAAHFAPEDVRRAEVFADRASTALAITLRHARQGQVTQQLEQALRSRSVIDQALGVLMGQQQCDAETAFGLLRQHSQHTNRKLRDVAAELVERISGHPPTEPPPFDVGSLLG